MWKDLLYFTKRERQGIWLLIIIISLFFLIHYFFSNRKEKIMDLSTVLSTDSTTVSTTTSSSTTSVPVTATGSPTTSVPVTTTVVTFNPVFFDPNTADSMTLLRLGLQPHVVRNVIRYRSKGGQFKSSVDFKKIYGVSPDLFLQLEPYIRIETKVGMTSKKKNEIKVEKYPLGIKVDLNTADTIELKKIPGIGSTYAKRIVAYRSILGGFYSTEQIREIYGFNNEIYNSVVPWLIVEQFTLQMISVNKESLERLKAHPYINFYQAKAIVDLRKKKGKLSSMIDLSLLEEFSENDLERLKYYLSFE